MAFFSIESFIFAKDSSIYFDYCIIKNSFPSNFINFTSKENSISQLEIHNCLFLNNKQSKKAPFFNIIRSYKLDFSNNLIVLNELGKEY